MLKCFIESYHRFEIMSKCWKFKLNSKICCKCYTVLFIFKVWVIFFFDSGLLSVIQDLIHFVQFLLVIIEYLFKCKMLLSFKLCSCIKGCWVKQVSAVYCAWACCYDYQKFSMVWFYGMQIISFWEILDIFVLQFMDIICLLLFCLLFQ